MRSLNDSYWSYFLTLMLGLNLMIWIHRWPLLCWETSRTSRMRGELTLTWPRTGRRMRRCVCGRCRWWTGAHWLNPLSTWLAKWPSHRASPLSLSVAIRIRAVGLQTAEWPDTDVMFKKEEKGRRVVLKGNLVLLKNSFDFFMKD